MADFQTKSEMVTIRGTAKFGNVHRLDQWGKRSCAIYPDQQSMAKVHKLISEGIKNKINKDDDGYKITFSRPERIKTKTRGDVELEPVRVTDKEGNNVSNQQIPDGSDITMTLETYGGKSPTGFGTYKAARLAEIKIH